MSPRKPVTNEAIGELVRKQRKKRGISQGELGDAIGVGMMMISKYESGASPITVVRLVDIAMHLKCRTIDLIP